MRIVPNPGKEAINRRKHGWTFERVAQLFDHPVLELPDDRRLGYEQGSAFGLRG